VSGLTITGTNTALAQNTAPNGGQSSFDWMLTVNVHNVNVRGSSIEVSVKGPSGYSDHQNIPNGSSPSASFNIPAGAIPAGSRYEVCVVTGTVALSPKCTPFFHSQDADSIVTVSP
jgi:hypothetical protein